MSDMRQEGPGPYDHPDTRTGSLGVGEPAPAPDAELDELLEAALPCAKNCAETLASVVEYLPGEDLRWREPVNGEHRDDCPARYRPALRRHLAAWAAAKGAEAELLRKALEELRDEIRDDGLCCDICGADEDAGEEHYSCPFAALARPWPSASGLLELRESLRCGDVEVGSLYRLLSEALGLSGDWRESRDG